MRTAGGLLQMRLLCVAVIGVEPAAAQSRPVENRPQGTEQARGAGRRREVESAPVDAGRRDESW